MNHIPTIQNCGLADVLMNDAIDLQVYGGGDGAGFSLTRKHPWESSVTWNIRKI